MVSGWSILFMFLNGILCIGIPIGGYLYFRVKKVGYIGIFIAGALSFYLTQMVIRIPILQLALPKMEWYVNLADKESFLYPVGLALFLGGTAALFETFGRFITLNYLLQKRLSYRSGIVHGLGHGGINYSSGWLKSSDLWCIFANAQCRQCQSYDGYSTNGTTAGLKGYTHADPK